MEIGEKRKLITENEVITNVDPEIEGSLSLGRKPDSEKGEGSMAIGTSCEASAPNSAAIGNYCRSTGKYSFSANNNCQATKDRATAFGQSTKASGLDQFVCGKYNIEDINSNFMFIVGNGTNSQRSNAFTVSKNGDGKFDGEVTDGDGNSLSGLAASLEEPLRLSKYGVKFKVKKLLQFQTFTLKPNMIALVQTSSSGQIVCNNNASPIDFNDLAIVFCSGFEYEDSDLATGHYRCIVTWKTGSGVLASTDMKTCDHAKNAVEYYVKNMDDVNMWVSYVERAE